MIYRNYKGRMGGDSIGRVLGPDTRGRYYEIVNVDYIAQNDVSQVGMKEIDPSDERDAYADSFGETRVVL